MEEKNLICIGCPMGCPLTVKMEHGEVVSVTGNTCKRGDIYARKEVTNPTRIVTSTVRVTGGSEAMVSVKTKEDIPKGKIFDCVKALKSVVLPLFGFPASAIFTPIFYILLFYSLINYLTSIISASAFLRDNSYPRTVTSTGSPSGATLRT